MNTNLLNIVKRIAAEQGEGILGDPQRLKSFVKDYAKDEPKEDRMAFGRCVEAGAYARFKNTRTEAERRQVKTALLPQLRAASGQSAAACQNALDLLEAVLFGIPQSAPSPQYQVPPGCQQPSYQQPQNQQQAYQPSAAAWQPTAPAHKKTGAGVFVFAAALILVIVAVSQRDKILSYLNAGSVNVWKGYDDFDSFSRAADMDEFLGEKLTEEAFRGLLVLGWLFSDEIHLDIVSGNKLTERYEVPESLRRNYQYLVKRDRVKGSMTYCAWFNGETWAVVYWNEG
ncbi:MAG: hypothetical protein Pg6C_14850 [Treponemataceae bacterium]|nr:MAG: hypothetical protein Pg6C_14850 [Treponemataceae bacterium]